MKPTAIIMKAHEIRVAANEIRLAAGSNLLANLLVCVFAPSFAPKQLFGDMFSGSGE